MTDIGKTSYMALPGLKFEVMFYGGNQATINNIIDLVTDEFGVTLQQMKSGKRYREWVEARMVAMFFIKRYCKSTLKSIGMMFGGRDHTTAIHSINTVKDLMESNRDFKNRVLTIQNKLAPDVTIKN